jgi:hypothetical protein
VDRAGEVGGWPAGDRGTTGGQRGVSLQVLSMSGTQSLDTSTATGSLMVAVIGVVGQAEA